jgi:hypothetical protein
MKVKIDEVLAHVQRSINNLSRLFSTRNERGVCVLDPELAGTICTGLMTNIGVVERLVDEAFAASHREATTLKESLERRLEQQRVELDTLREQLEAAQRGDEAAGLRTHIEYLEALLDLIRKDQKKPKKDRKTVLQLEQVLTQRLGLAVPDAPVEDDEEPS